MCASVDINICIQFDRTYNIGQYNKLINRGSINVVVFDYRSTSQCIAEDPRMHSSECEVCSDERFEKGGKVEIMRRPRNRPPLHGQGQRFAWARQ